jgi:hypothetical protein
MWVDIADPQLHNELEGFISTVESIVMPESELVLV